MNIANDTAPLLPALALLATVGLGLLAALRRVPEGEAFTIQRLGRYLRTLGPGWHFTVPVLDRVRSRVRLLGHHVDIHVCRPGAADAEVYYQILEPGRTGQALEEIDLLVEREAVEQLAALAAENDAPSGPVLARRLKEELNRHLGRLGLLVIRCQLHLPTA